jgi:hypothetical protein
MEFDKAYWNRMLPKKPFLSTVDLLNLGLFGSKQGWYRAIKDHDIPIFYISQKRMVAQREDVIKFLVERSQIQINVLD